LEEAITLTGLFIKQGPIVQVKNPPPLGKVIVEPDTDPSVLYDGPLLVLTSRFSASASEIMAGALQDYGRALIVGDKSTHGKGTVQQLFELARFIPGAGENENDGALKITIRKFYRATGSSTQNKGVTPDIILPSPNNVAEVGESSLDNHLEWDTIQGREFEELSRIQPILPELKARSEKRVAADPDFAYLRDEIERIQKAQADKTVSLNEAVRLREKDEAKARADRRKEELKRRPPVNEVVYELTVSQSAQNGLPDPIYPPKENSEALQDTAKAGKANAAHAAAGVDDPEDDSFSPVDVTLKEAKHILADLIDLRTGSAALAAKRGL
jgi:carboxyl-terminal processing protease